MKTLIGFALGTLLSLGTVTAAFASGTSVAAPLTVPDDGIETIVVTAKRPVALPVDEVEVIVVTAKRPAQPNAADRTPPAWDDLAASRPGSVAHQVSWAGRVLKRRSGNMNEDERTTQRPFSFAGPW